MDNECFYDLNTRNNYLRSSETMTLIKKTKLSFLSLCWFSLIAGHYSSAYANGFRLPEYTAAGVATSNALVADTSRISAIAYNPAIMTLYSSGEKEPNSYLLSSNIIHIEYDTEVTVGTTTTQGNGKSKFNVPNLFISNQLSNKFSLGLLIHSPFGLETAWPRNTFSSFGGIAALETDLSRIKMFNTNVNLGYQLTPNTGIAVGINYYELLDLQFNSHATVIKGTGEGYGMNVALISKYEDISFGLSYRSAVHANATGTASTSPATPIEVDITFPEMLTLGINYKVNDALKLELDIEHTGWNVYDNLNIRNSSDQSTLTLSTNNWKDTITYRTSAQYKIDKHQILFGYAYDKTPQSDNYFTARVPDSDRQLFSIGYQYDFGTYQFETGLMLVKFKDRNVNSSTSYTFASDPNGTTAYNGRYRSNATVLSVGVNMIF